VDGALSIICSVLTWGLVFFAEWVVSHVMLLPDPYSTHNVIAGGIFHMLAFLAVASHMKAMLTDPGAVPRGNATRENILKMGLKEGQVVFKCPKCDSIKPDRAHHCSVCRRCVCKMDHHCPWVNNCVGENNQKYFVLFTLYICLISCHAVYMAIRHFVVCVGGRTWPRHCSLYSPVVSTILLIFLLIESILFGIFTAIMCSSQLSAICSDETGIEKIKSENGTWEKKSCWLSLKEVFGHNFSWRWFSPFHPAVIIRPVEVDLEGGHYEDQMEGISGDRLSLTRTPTHTGRDGNLCRRVWTKLR